MDLDSSESGRSIDTTALFWLRSTLFVTLFISALGALVSFRSIQIYGGAMAGFYHLVEGTYEYDLFQAIQRNPVSRLALEGFNLVLWISVLIGAAYLLRVREWARVLVKTMITIDLFVTLGVAFWPAIAGRIQQTPTQSGVSVDLFITTVEVIIVVVLSHPRVVTLTQTYSSLREEIRRSVRTRDRRPDKTR